VKGAPRRRYRNQSTRRSRRSVGRSSLFGNVEHAKRFELRLKPRQPGRMVAHRCPGGPRAGPREVRKDRQTRLDCGTRLLETAQLRQRHGQFAIRLKYVAVGLDGPSTPRDRFLPAPKLVVRHGLRGDAEGIRGRHTFQGSDLCGGRRIFSGSKQKPFPGVTIEFKSVGIAVEEITAAKLAPDSTSAPA
jgi:hypothetical protein